MYSHITVGVSDLARSEQFYTAALAPLGVGLRDKQADWCGYAPPGEGQAFFHILTPLDGRPASAGNGSMAAFVARDRPTVDAVYAAAMANGGTCEGPPGLRPHYHGDYYGAYFRDPDGNKLHAVCHSAED